jgi:predicted nucleic acid-binding Zn ribbon protein
MQGANPCPLYPLNERRSTLKAKQAKAELPEMPKGKCHICGKESYPYGYIRHGKSQVCSRNCDELYNQKRRRNEQR